MFTNWQKIATAALGAACIVGAGVCVRYGLAEAGAGLGVLGGGLVMWVKKHWTDT